MSIVKEPPMLALYAATAVESAARVPGDCPLPRPSGATYQMFPDSTRTASRSVTTVLRRARTIALVAV